MVAFQVKKAFFALVANGVRAAPLWESKKQSFVGKSVCVCVGGRKTVNNYPPFPTAAHRSPLLSTTAPGEE